MTLKYMNDVLHSFHMTEVLYTCTVHLRSRFSLRREQDTMSASLSALLAHPSYGVRFEAAVALASLGSALPWCAAGLLQQVEWGGVG